ncbi:Leucine-rich repeat [Fragilaria crotonensis]|nr:Leucine-rich repeat [Fragilaria crotonensis]
MGGCVVLLVIVAVSVALGVTLGGKNGNSSSPGEDAAQPTDSPAAILSSACVAAVDDAGQSDRFLQFSDMLGVSEPDTARRAAISWLADSDGSHIDSTDSTLVKQQFELAAFYYSTLPDGGDHILTTWLGDDSECKWQGISCENEEVVNVGLSDVGLVGSIPPEVSFLSGLSQLLVDGNRLTGTLPDELYQ